MSDPTPASPPRRMASTMVACLLIVLVGAGLLVAGPGSALLTDLGNSLAEAGKTIDPPKGSLPWKLRHGERINLLLLGFGGSENDAPFLTDTMVVLSLDPAHHRVMEVAVPRDLSVAIDAWAGRPAEPRKVNEAYAIGRDNSDWPGKKPEFSNGKDRGGRLAEQTVSGFTGLRFDGYVGIDFKAFRDTVNALGGIEVCLDGPLDDNQYPDYHDGYVKGGIHFKQGCQQVNGEQALQLARSRHAVQPGEASDFARSRRQQLILQGIRQKATSANAITRAPALMDAMQKDIDTSLTFADLKALFDWSRGVSDASVGHAGITGTDFLEAFYLRRGTCGDFREYTLCPEDPTFGELHTFFSNLFIDPQVLKEGAPVQVMNGSRSIADLGERVTSTLQPLGFKVQPPARVKSAEKTIVYNYSGGRYPLTAQWLATYFGGTVVAPPTAPSTPNQPTGGLAVLLGHQYALRWIGQGSA